MSDSEEKSLIIERVFDAPRELVWKAWTEPELIKQWWGPEGFSAPSIQIDLRVGGKYIYAMQGPAGSEWDRVMYSAGDFKEVVPMEKIVVSDYFSDEHGNKISPAKEGQPADFPTEMNSTILFEDLPAGRHGAGEGRTKVSVIYPKPESEAQLQAMLKSGMKEGWTSSLNKLARVVEAS